MNQPQETESYIRKAWISEAGEILPDYAYPLVKFLHSRIKPRGSETYLSISKVSLPTEVQNEVIILLKARLALLNNGEPTRFLGVLPDEEKAIFNKALLHKLPDERQELVSCFGKDLTTRIHIKVVSVLWKHVLHVFNIYETETEWVDDYPKSFGKAFPTILSALILGIISLVLALLFWVITGVTALINSYSRWEQTIAEMTGSSAIELNEELFFFPYAVGFTVITIIMCGIFIGSSIFFNKDVPLSKKEPLLISYLTHNSPSLDSRGLPVR